MADYEYCDALSDLTIQRLKDSMLGEETDKPHVFVIFGASGDLAKKKIYPTLWWLYRDGLLPSVTFFCGYARSHLSVPQIRANIYDNCKVAEGEKAKFDAFIERQSYVAGAYDTPEGFLQLDRLIDTTAPGANRIFYLALPPSVFEVVTAKLKEVCMAQK